MVWDDESPQREIPERYKAELLGNWDNQSKHRATDCSQADLTMPVIACPPRE